MRLLGPAGLGLVLGQVQVDVFIHVIDPADGDHVVFEAAGQVQLGQFDLVSDDVIDAPDVLAVS